LFDKGLIANKFHFYLEKFVSKIFDFLIVNSHFSYRTFVELTRKQIPHIILNPYSKITATAPITEAQYLSEKVILLQVGTIEERKNILNIIKALSTLKINFIYNIIGHCHSSSYHTMVTDLIAEYGMEEKVFIRGLVDSETLNDYYSKSSIFILVSKLEGYGMVYAEAMHYGLPIVGSTAGAVPELVENDVNGYLCNPEEYIQISEAIANISIKKNWDRFHQNNLIKSKTLIDKETFIQNATDLFRKMKDSSEMLVECPDI
jgi:glycosyltransferase involved in cell wall biosynthesis